MMSKEIEIARKAIKEYRKGYGQSQLPTDCIIQLMMGHAEKIQKKKLEKEYEKGFNAAVKAINEADKLNKGINWG